MKHWITLIIFCCSLLWSCSPKETKVESEKFPVTRLIRKDASLYQEYVSDIHALQNVEIRARVQGYLERIYADEGQEVKKGQPLFQINSEEYHAALSKAKANLNSARAEANALQFEMDRVKILVDKNVISSTELKLAKAKYDAALAKTEEARYEESHAAIRLSHTFIKAPFDGVMGRIPFKIGSLIDEGSLLTTVSDTKFIYAYFEISEREYLEYSRNLQNKDDDAYDDAELVLADGSNHRYKGKIETIEGEFGSATGTIAFRAKFPNPDKLLKHGSSGKVRLTTDMHQAIMVPQKSTVEIQDKTYVFVVDKKGKVKMKSFTPKARFSDFYIIESGLLAGEKVVYEGVQNVRDGMLIEPAYLSMDSIMFLADNTL